jgi:hypothetical protein
MRILSHIWPNRRSPHLGFFSSLWGRALSCTIRINAQGSKVKSRAVSWRSDKRFVGKTKPSLPLLSCHLYVLVGPYTILTLGLNLSYKCWTFCTAREQLAIACHTRSLEDIAIYSILEGFVEWGAISKRCRISHTSEFYGYRSLIQTCSGFQSLALVWIRKTSKPSIEKRAHFLLAK